MTASDSLTAPMSTYYVVPLIPDQVAADFKIQKCNYYDASWTLLPDPPVLNSLAQGYATDFVRIVQPTIAQLQAQGIDISKVDAQVTLFAGIAKTLKIDLLLPNFSVASDRTMIVPVANETRRGLILIFMRNVGGIITQLIATSDPEIKNSTNGT